MPIFRYTFSDYMQSKMIQFSNLHKYDDRHAFKESFIEWKEVNKQLINEETNLLLEIGYIGDVEKKMFYSVKYYFSKLQSTQRVNIKNKLKPKNLNFPNDEIMLMERFIQTNPDEKPSVLYRDYIDIHQKENTIRLKKSFKNKHYTLIKKNSHNSNSK